MTSPAAIVTLGASPVRRVFAVFVLAALAFICIGIALTTWQAPVVWHLVLVAIGVAALVLGEWLRRATTLRIELTREGLQDSSGRSLAPFADIVAVERGVFAFKPSNGFLVKLARPAPRGWAPGLWWRYGRRLGVGGVTPGHQARYMAETLAVMLVEREG